MTQVQHAPLLAYLAAQDTLPPMSTVALRAAVVLSKWSTRHRTRKHLVNLDPHLLKDVGLDRHAALTEARRKFWQG
ncbi:DUF1127 domain-containing protein [Pseudoprimorskyibacter insulae]|uniref:YjiS-like domain-containing protein n=1 Tax=Pseudoprimorskyibacter insulae TaxID=1695997 RepID=A0A2R8AWT0_9RHOB|nr:DUF1127 domain-containing protein [Pseudoprimorskyibacter insulae]SPF80448.1 hypothetical protein PRI8871_02254 [Pseudoprimorskyibacter insulae]